MKWFMGLVLAASLITTVTGEEKVSVVVEPIDNKPVTVKKGTPVRVQVSGIAGSKFTVKLDGKAKYTTTRVIKLAGKSPLIGGDTYEYTVEGSEAGKVTLEVTIKSPNGDDRKVTQEITVE